MTNRITETKRSSTTRRRHDALTITLMVVAVVLGAALIWSLQSQRSPDQPSTSTCGKAAERFAQIDATWTAYTLNGLTGLSIDEQETLAGSRDTAAQLLKACRAAG